MESSWFIGVELPVEDEGGSGFMWKEGLLDVDEEDMFNVKVEVEGKKKSKVKNRKKSGRAGTLMSVFGMGMGKYRL